MTERERHDDGMPRIPQLLRFLGLHLALGAALGVAVVSLLLLTNLAGLKQLIVDAQNPFVPLLLLYSFNIITFSSVVMGIGVMTMPLEPGEQKDAPQDRPETEAVRATPKPRRASEAKRRTWTHLP